MLEENLIDVASTDLHHTHDFKTLEDAMWTLVSIDANRFERLFSTTPALIHEGRIDELLQDE